MTDSERSKILRKARNRAMIQLRIEHEERYEQLYAAELEAAGAEQRARPQAYRARPERRQES